jgi:hypothetical protein
VRRYRLPPASVYPLDQSFRHGFPQTVWKAHRVSGVIKESMAVLKHHKPRKHGERLTRENIAGSQTTEAALLPSDLHLSARSSLMDMAPSDIILLDDFTYLRESFSPNFVAVLACPLCGSPGLITSAQFSGGGPIVCTSKLCSGLFRIIDEARIVALPPS